MMKRIALIRAIIMACALVFAGNNGTAASAAADTHSIYGNWVCIVETEDANDFVFFLLFIEPGDVTFTAGWVQGEIAGFYTGCFTIIDDGVLSLEMTDNESSDTLIGTYSFHVSEDTLLLSNQSGDCLSYLFKAGEPITFYAINEVPETADLPLLEYLNDPILIAFAENFDKDFPISVSVRHDGEASGTPVTVTDSETIRAVFEALQKITVLGKWPVSGHTDDYLYYYFEMPDGRMIYGFEFQDGMLLDSRMGLYEIKGFDMLQYALPDPGAW